jgi:hypothetical protein
VAALQVCNDSSSSSGVRCVIYVRVRVVCGGVCKVWARLVAFKETCGVVRHTLQGHNRTHGRVSDIWSSGVMPMIQQPDRPTNAIDAKISIVWSVWRG